MSEQAQAVDMENQDHENIEQTTTDPVIALEQKIQQLESQLAEHKDQMLRAVAEAENIRRRAERDREDISKYAVTSFARDLLGLSDNLRRALDAVPADQRPADGIWASLLTGVEMTEREFLSVLTKHGVQRVDPVGQKFDPNFHQAVFEVPNTGQAAGTVVQVVQAGYVIHGRLLRPAMVGVAKMDPEATPHVDTKA